MSSSQYKFKSGLLLVTITQMFIGQNLELNRAKQLCLVAPVEQKFERSPAGGRAI